MDITPVADKPKATPASQDTPAITAGGAKQQTSLTKFEDVSKLADEAAASGDVSIMRDALASIKAFAEFRLKKIKARAGDDSAGKAVLAAMDHSRAFKPWEGMKNESKPGPGTV